MSAKILLISFIAVLAIGELGLFAWQNLPIERSSAPVFSFPAAAANFDSHDHLTRAIKMYGADRGAEWNTSPNQIPRITTFYLEWDQIDRQYSMHLDGHAPEVCNVSAGFKLVSILPPRTYSHPDHPPLVFDASHFTDPVGRNIYVFKMPWIQGLNSLSLWRTYSRLERLKASLVRHRGAARVLQAGVFEAENPEHAWQAFSQEVLDQLEWN